MRPAAVIVLAAGEGTRMKSKTPKILHRIGGRTLVEHALRTAAGLEPEHLAVVVGVGREQVIAHLGSLACDARIVVQEDRSVVGRYGTGYAARLALESLPALDGTVVVTYGDVPLLTTATLEALLRAHENAGAAATVLSAHVDDPAGYGRIVRGPDGTFEGIVEHKDASDRQREIDEINSGIYAFAAGALGDALARVKTDNVQGEEYLTDVLAILRADGRTIAATPVEDSDEVLGVNNRIELADLGRKLNATILESWMVAGVTIVDPATTWIEDTVTLARDVTVWPNTYLRGDTTVAEDAELGPGVTLQDCVVEPGARVVQAYAQGAVIGPAASVGPYAYLRPGAKLGHASKVGTFVEVKNSELGEGTKAQHLSYVGDATIGAGCNLGAGTIFANYDGIEKHHTDVGDAVFVGSDSVVVAPRTIGSGSYVAAGSTVTKDVEPGQLAVARGQQRNIDGWVERKRPGTSTARAAAESVRAGGQAGRED